MFLYEGLYCVRPNTEGILSEGRRFTANLYHYTRRGERHSEGLRVAGLHNLEHVADKQGNKKA